MNVLSISELQSYQVVLLNTLSALAKDVLVLELDIRSNNGYYLSRKIDFGRYTKEIIEGLYLYIDYFNEIIEWFYSLLTGIIDIVNARIRHLNELINEFLLQADALYMHKSLRYGNGTEDIISEDDNPGASFKCFKDDGDSRGNTVAIEGTLHADNVIEGVAKRTLYYE